MYTSFIAISIGALRSCKVDFVIGHAARRGKRGETFGETPAILHYHLSRLVEMAEETIVCLRNGGSQSVWGLLQYTKRAGGRQWAHSLGLISNHFNN